jgi:hypothetical protein
LKKRGHAVEPLAKRGPREYAAGGRRHHGGAERNSGSGGWPTKKLVLHVSPKSRAPDTIDVAESSVEGRPRHRGPPPPRGNIYRTQTTTRTRISSGMRNKPRIPVARQSPFAGKKPVIESAAEAADEYCGLFVGFLMCLWESVAFQAGPPRGDALSQGEGGYIRHKARKQPMRFFSRSRPLRCLRLNTEYAVSGGIGCFGYWQA